MYHPATELCHRQEEWRLGEEEKKGRTRYWGIQSDCKHQLVRRRRKAGSGPQLGLPEAESTPISIPETWTRSN